MTLDTLSDMKVVDVDSHLTEPPDLWTSRVSSKDQDRVPRKVRDENGRDTWYFDGDRIFGRPAGASSVIRLDGSKQSFWDWNIQAGLQWDEVDPGSYDLTRPASAPTSWPSWRTRVWRL
jgi:hypothetical protein